MIKLFKEVKLSQIKLFYVIKTNILLLLFVTDEYNLLL